MQIAPIKIASRARVREHCYAVGAGSVHVTLHVSALCGDRLSKSSTTAEQNSFATFLAFNFMPEINIISKIAILSIFKLLAAFVIFIRISFPIPLVAK